MDQVRIDIITPTYSTVVPYGMTIMQRSSHETPDSILSTSIFFARASSAHYFYYAKILARDRFDKFKVIISIRQLILLNTILYTRQSVIIIAQYFYAAILFAQYFYYATILARNRCIPPLIFYTMQRSSHETDSTSYLHVSVNITAQYFYYAKILTRNRFRTRQIHSTTYLITTARTTKDTTYIH